MSLRQRLEGLIERPKQGACRARNAAGERCRSTSVDPETGLCAAHGKLDMAAMGRASQAAQRARRERRYGVASRAGGVVRTAERRNAVPSQGTSATPHAFDSDPASTSEGGP
jgi:hypothetical protein